MDIDKYLGVFMGLLIGDALGAPFESGFLERLVWRFIGKKAGKQRYTDDTEMSIVLAKHFIKYNRFEPNILAQEFAKEVKWSRGYGRGAVYILKKIEKGMSYQKAATLKYKNGSFGNGAAMRVAIVTIALFNKGIEEIFKAVKNISETTHMNQEAIEGAKIIAYMVYMAMKIDINKIDKLPSLNLNDSILNNLLSIVSLKNYKEKIEFIKESINGETLTKSEIIKFLGNGIAAINSVPFALYSALKYKDSDIKDMLNYIYKVGGDTDTIGAMAGAIWGAINGLSSIQKATYSKIEGVDLIMDLSEKLFLAQKN
ncbi:ADP-ribosylglycohydrolase family protein [bacterium]|nr:ADP-ribosylglycohydrolase family protein [bacterium]